MCHTVVGSITLKGKKCLLMVGEDKRWYKAFITGTYKEDPIHNSPTKSIIGEATPLTEKEFKTYFG